jgi:hypothetical protein
VPDLVVFRFADVRARMDRKPVEADELFLLVDHCTKDKLDDYLCRLLVSSSHCETVCQIVPQVVAMPFDLPKSTGSAMVLRGPAEGYRMKIQRFSTELRVS